MKVIDFRIGIIKYNTIANYNCFKLINANKIKDTILLNIITFVCKLYVNEIKGYNTTSQNKDNN